MKKTFYKIKFLAIICLALSLPLAAIAATVTADDSITVSLPNGIELVLLGGALAEQITVNDDSTLTITGGADTAITVVSYDKYDLSSSLSAGSATIVETCTTGLNNELVITTSAAATMVVSVDSSSVCDASSSSSGSSTTSGGSSGTPSAGTGTNTLTVSSGQTRTISNLVTTGTNVFMYIDSTLGFNALTSSGGTQDHLFKIINLDLVIEEVTIQFNSEPIIISLLVGESDQVDLDADGIDDVKVKFNDLIVNKVDITVTGIAVSKDSGNLVKLECGDNAGVNDICRQVYYVGADGKRYVFPNFQTYNTWYSDFSGVTIVSSETMASYKIGGNATYRPGVRMIKIQTDPKVYAVGAGGALRWVSTSEVAEELYGANWASMIDDVANTFFTDYQDGADIIDAVAFDKSAVKDVAANINTDKGL